MSYPLPSVSGVFHDRRRWIPLRYGVPPRSAVETVLGKPCSPNFQQLRKKTRTTEGILVN